jgi:hypothetical protein
VRPRRSARRLGRARGPGAQVRALVVAAAALLVAAALAGPTPAAAARTGQNTGFTALPATLPTSISTTAGSWASVPMGRLAEPLNTFWQLFLLPKGGSRWANHAAALATATNGGLVLASPGGRTLLVAIRASNLLRFSPVVSTSNGGRSWSPGLPIIGDIEALAASNMGGQLALADTSGSGEVLTSSAKTSSWRTLASEQSLAATAPGRRCDVIFLTSVAYGADGSVLVGAACRSAGVAGVFTLTGRTWRLADVALPTALAADRVEVLSFRAAADSTVALLELNGPTGITIVPAWMHQGTKSWTWQVSSTLHLTSSERLISFGPATGGGLFVLLANGSVGTRVVVVAGPGAAWKTMPELSTKTVTVAFGPNRRVDALAVDGKTMRDYQFAGRSGKWRLTQTIPVGILYGSSS